MDDKQNLFTDYLERIENRQIRLESLLITNKSVLTLEEASIYTGISKSWLYKLTSTGVIPHSKPNGKLIYFDRSELENWMLQNRNVTTTEIEEKALSYVTSSFISHSTKGKNLKNESK